MNNIPIVLDTLEESIAKEQLDELMASQQANESCANFLKNQLVQNFIDNRLHVNAIIENTVESYGVDRTKLVLAYSLQYFDRVGDGRVSRENKEWAKNIPVPRENNHDMVVDNAGLVNMIVEKFKNSEKSMKNEEEKEEKQSVTDSLETI